MHSPPQWTTFHPGRPGASRGVRARHSYMGRVRARPSVREFVLIFCGGFSFARI